MLAGTVAGGQRQPRDGHLAAGGTAGARAPTPAPRPTGLPLPANAPPTARRRATAWRGLVLASWVAGASLAAAAEDPGARLPERDIDTLVAAGNKDPIGLWSDGSTLWVVDSLDNQVYAYGLADGVREATRDIDEAAQTYPGGVWSDGETLWVLDYYGGAVAHVLATGTRDSDRGRAGPRRLGRARCVVGWRHGVGGAPPARHRGGAQRGDRRAAGGARHRAGRRERRAHGAVVGRRDVVGGRRGRAAFVRLRAGSGARLPRADFDTLRAANNHAPYGLWSDGATLWVADYSADKVFAYRYAPTQFSANLASLTVTGAAFAFDPAVLEHAATVGAAYETVTVAAVAEVRRDGTGGHGRGRPDARAPGGPRQRQRRGDGAGHRHGWEDDAPLPAVADADAVLGDAARHAERGRRGGAAGRRRHGVRGVGEERDGDRDGGRERVPRRGDGGGRGVDAEAEAAGHQVDLSEGANTVSVVVTAEDGATRAVTLTVTRLPADGDTRLSSLRVGALELGFHADVTAYAVTVPFTIASLTVAADAADGTATAVIAGADDDADRPGRQAALAVEANTVTVTVTAADGSTRTYTVTVMRSPASADATLAALSLSGVELGFEPGTTTYTAGVAYAVASVTVSAAAADARAVVAVTPSADDDAAAAGQQVALAVGANTITATVTAEDGTTRAYTVTATRAAASDDASLASLAVSGAELAFDPAATSYTAAVSYYAEQVTVVAVPAHPAATVAVTPADASPAAGDQVALAVGTNAISVTVTAEDGSTGTYGVSVRRKAASETAELPESLSQDVLVEFIEARGIDSVAAVVEALPPLHRRHFLAVHGSHSPVAEFISTSHPRIVSWGADAQFVMTWTTSDDEHPFREGLEFLEAKADEGRWVAGVIDFSGDAPALRHPSACAGCHGDNTKPLWGSNRWQGTESEHSDSRATATERTLYATMADATHPRLVPLERWPYRTAETRLVPLQYAQVPANEEFSAMLSSRHAQVLFARLKARGDYRQIAESLACGDYRSRVLELFEQSEFAPNRLSATGAQFQGTSTLSRIEAGDYYDGSYLSDRITLLAFHDLWRSDGSVRGVYRWTRNDFGTPPAASRYAPGTATMEAELVAAHAEFFGLRGQAQIDRRRARISRAPSPAYAQTFTQYHLVEFRRQVCAAARSRASPLFDPASAVAGLTLVNADLDADAGALADGATVRMPAGESLSIRADVADGAGIASVGFALAGPLSVERMATGGQPFALFGASYGDYGGRVLPPGAYRLTATPYSRVYGGGERGEPLTVSFTVAEPVGRAPAADIESLGGAGNAAPRGVFSDGDTVWVVDATDARLYAYSHGGVRRAGSDIALAADNAAPGGAWSDGTTWWVSDTDDAKVYAYGADGGRLSGRDIDLAAGATPTAVWSDGETMWVADRAGAALLAYALADGARREARDIALAAGNAAPAGLWSDGLTLWVSDAAAGRLYAYALAGGARDASRDIATAAAGNGRPTGLWSDSETVWVGDAGDAKLYAYDLPAETRLRALAVGGEPVPPAGTTSEYRLANEAYATTALEVTAMAATGSTVTVAGAGADGRVALAEGENAIRITVTDGDASRTYTLRVRRALSTESSDARLAALTLSDADLAFSAEVLEYSARVVNSVDAVDLAFRTESDAAVAVVTPADGDPAVAGHQIVLGYGEDRAWTSSSSRARVTITVTAEDRVNVRTYAVAVRRSHGSESYARLNGLSLSGVDPLPFDRNTFTYTAQAGYMPWTTVRGRSGSDWNASMTVHGEDVSGRSGHQAALAPGDNVVTVTATSADGLVSQDYTVNLQIGPPTVVQVPADDILVKNQPKTQRGYKSGIWSDGLRLWVVWHWDVLEFDLATKSHLRTHAMSTSANITGFWSDGGSLWGADVLFGAVQKASPDSPGNWWLAFRLGDAGMSHQWDLWSDGETMWVVLDKIDWRWPASQYNRPAQLHAVDMAGTAQPEKSFKGLEAFGNSDPRGNWSDGSTMWVTDDAGAKVYAYALYTWERRPLLDLNVLEAAGNTNPRGIWSDGSTMWILDTNSRIYAYSMPVPVAAETDATTLCGRSGSVRVAVMAALRAAGTVGEAASCGEVTAAQLASVETLDLRGRSPTLRAGDLDGLTGLANLDLGGNRLGDLPSDVFDGPSSLRRLELDGNGLDADDLGFLSDLGSLDELGLADNALAGELVPAWFTGTPTLTRLDLGGNGLTGVPARAFAGLPALRELRLGDNSLAAVPADAFTGLGQLEVLTLDGNALAALAEGTFTGLTVLGTLDLSGNALAALPAEVFDDVAALTALDLSNNALAALPADVFGGLAALDSLDLAGNALAGLPAGLFAGLASLTALDLSANVLAALPDDVFAGLATLAALALGDNATDPLELAVSLEKTGDLRLRASVAAGAPFALDVPVAVAGGTLSASAGALAVAAGATGSATAEVALDEAGDDPATAMIGDLPGLPDGHAGYVLAKSGDALSFARPVVPGAPTALTAQALGVASIGLSWGAPGHTGASALTGYRIEASADGGETWAELSTVAADATEHVHAALPAGSTRDYQVYAVNDHGTGTAATARATTRVAVVSITGPGEAVAEGGQAEFVLERTDPAGAPALAVTAAVAGDGLAGAPGARSVAFEAGVAATTLSRGHPRRQGGRRTGHGRRDGRRRCRVRRGSRGDRGGGGGGRRRGGLHGDGVAERDRGRARRDGDGFDRRRRDVLGRSDGGADRIGHRGGGRLRADADLVDADGGRQLGDGDADGGRRRGGGGGRDGDGDGEPRRHGDRHGDGDDRGERRAGGGRCDARRAQAVGHRHRPVRCIDHGLLGGGREGRRVDHGDGDADQPRRDGDDLGRRRQHGRHDANGVARGRRQRDHGDRDVGGRRGDADLRGDGDAVGGGLGRPSAGAGHRAGGDLAPDRHLGLPRDTHGVRVGRLQGVRVRLRRHARRRQGPDADQRRLSHRHLVRRHDALGGGLLRRRPGA